MMPSDAASSLRPEFNDFLFAPVGDDEHDMTLSVLSALARLDVDPWKEAADLSELPRKRAIERLAALLARLPPPAKQADPSAIAARLLALLPDCRSSAGLSHETLLDLGAMTDPQAVIPRTVIYVIFTVFVLAAIFNATYPSPSPAGSEAPPAAISSPSPPQAAPDIGRH
jgi:hypothetical protein